MCATGSRIDERAIWVVLQQKYCFNLPTALMKVIHKRHCLLPRTSTHFEPFDALRSFIVVTVPIIIIIKRTAHGIITVTAAILGLGSVLGSVPRGAIALHFAVIGVWLTAVDGKARGISVYPGSHGAGGLGA